VAEAGAEAKMPPQGGPPPFPLLICKNLGAGKPPSKSIRNPSLIGKKIIR
jgi:hypothetical protein